MAEIFQGQMVQAGDFHCVDVFNKAALQGYRKDTLVPHGRETCELESRR